MVFSSILFIYYFAPVALALYYITGCRNSVILTASVVFYVWGEGAFVFLLLALVFANHRLGLMLEAATVPRKKLLLTIGVAGNLAVLGAFKYTAFFVDTLSPFVEMVGWGKLPHLTIHLPIGISFFIFQFISYVIDVGGGTVKAETSLIRLATYIMMFPHLLAGPIVRYRQIVTDLQERHLNETRILLGAQYFIVGLTQKVLIANTVTAAANYAFDTVAPDKLDAATAWIGTIAYSLQIYFDFGGYSNMAIGLAFLMGFRFPRNFDFPYAAQSMSEFWRKWHMSLSFWFRDYVYIPLGGNRGTKSKTIRNLLFVFFFTGLWHGAGWTFVLWGLYHGAFLLMERAGLVRVLNRLPSLLRHLYTVLVVMGGWILFRAGDIGQAADFLQAMVGLGGVALKTQPLLRWLTPEVIAAMLAGVIFSVPTLPKLLTIVGVPLVKTSSDLIESRLDTMVVHRLPGILLAISFLLCTAMLAGRTLNPFLYYRF